MQLKDKVILITGSTTGIGAALARLFVSEGARVILHGREEEKGKALRKELGGATTLHFHDLLDPRSPELLVKAALQDFERLDVLVNNAALTTRTDLTTTDAAMFDRMIGVNLRAPLLLIRAAQAALEASKGAVLNIGSVLAHCGQSNLLAYSITKGGLMTMTRNLADALGPRQIRVNQLNLGWTLSENEYAVKVSDGMPPDWPEHLPVTSAPSGKLLMPEDIARCALYWASDASRPISGTVAEIEQYPVIGRFTNHDSLKHE